MTTWTKQKLGDLITIKHGYAFKGEYFVDHPTSNILLTPGNFAIGGGFQLGNTKYYDGPTTPDYILNKGDLIVTMTDLSKQGDTLGFPAKVPADEHHQYLHNQRIGLITKKSDDIDLEFLYYLMRTYKYQRFIVGSASGSTVHHTSPTKVYEYLTEIPDLTTQKRVASILGCYDSLIENNEKRIKILEEMAQRLYEEWFVKFKFPDRKKVKMVDSGTEYGMIPAGWGVNTLNQVVYINPLTKVHKNNVLHISMECLSGTLSVIDISKTSRNDTVSGSKFINGDTLFARITPCLQNGKTGYVNILDDGESACGSTEFVVLRQKILTSVYIYLLSRTNNFRDTAIFTMVGASGRQRVRSEFFESYQVLVPDESLLKDFEHRVSINFSEIKVLYRSNMILSKIRDLLIPQLITGKKLLKGS